MSRKVESVHDLVVWQKAHEITRQLYEKTSKFPKKELALFVPQIRNIAVQIPTNITIGFNKRSKKAKVHYYRTALNSIEEIKYLLELAQDLGMYKDAYEIINEFENVERMLKRLIRSNVTGKE